MYIPTHETALTINEPVEALVAAYKRKRDAMQAVIDATKPLEMRFDMDYQASHKQHAWQDLIDKLVSIAAGNNLSKDTTGKAS